MGTNRIATLHRRSIMAIALLALMFINLSTMTTHAQTVSGGEAGEEVTPNPLSNSAPSDEVSLSVTSSTTPTPSFMEQMAVLVNQFRAQNGLPPLKVVPELNKAAQDYAVRLGQANFFGHNDPDFNCNKPSERALSAGYSNWSNIGENVAAGYATPQAAFDAFKASDGHRAAMLSPNFRDFGAGYFYDANDAANVRQDGNCPYSGTGGPYRYYWAQEFGSRYNNGVPELPIVINAEAMSSAQRQVTLYVYGGIYGQPTWATQMRFSMDGTNWSAYEPWSATKVLMLPDNPGLKTVYAQISNGSSTQTVSDTIYLDISSAVNTNVTARAFVPIAVR